MFIFPELGRMVIVGLMILVPVCASYIKKQASIQPEVSWFFYPG
ncbi:hypothetical protein BMETH_3227_0 [methanotrophic bacterial endosymbiont of Bathymodiolus sp.]|nr:hypothetical protein BMETH_3227_0 [methanotrophic bacterial endosymbiont of Bathymodiolus sp.]